MIQHKKTYGIYHWDTFDNETILVGERNTIKLAEKFVNERYKGRISNNGADQVEIVDKEGNIVKKFKVG